MTNHNKNQPTGPERLAPVLTIGTSRALHPSRYQPPQANRPADLEAERVETGPLPEPMLGYLGAEAEELAYVLDSLHRWIQHGLLRADALADWALDTYGDEAVIDDVTERLERLAHHATRTVDEIQP